LIDVDDSSHTLSIPNAIFPIPLLLPSTCSLSRRRLDVFDIPCSEQGSASEVDGVSWGGQDAVRMDGWMDGWMDVDG
jgi:hypothetical protein